jgi:phage gp36-like protein
MTYATLQDLITAIGEDELISIADHDRDGTINAEAVERALAAASALIDSHLAVRWPTPLASVPDLIRDLAIDIAIYKLAGPSRGLTDEQRQRYEDALKLLGRLADGKATLDLPPPQPTVSKTPVLMSGSKRLFSRDRLRGL